MPLAKGSGPDAIGANIAELIRSGHEPAQAAAIAYRVARGEDSAAGICYRSGDSVLLLLRAAAAGDYPLTWCFPGGGMGPEETAEQAAIRESQEEVAYAPADPLTVLDYDGGFTTFACVLPERFVPTLNEEHIGFVWAPLANLPQPLHPGVATTLSRVPQAVFGMDKREYDGNGWFEIKANPISKAGVFPYSGAQLGLTGDDAGRIFQVFRPPEELADPECLNSFKLLPWVDDHTMLGPVAMEAAPDRALPAERKGVQGVTGEEVFFKDGVLYANIKAFSSTLAALIEAGKRELSAGYCCKYFPEAGEWMGQAYQFVQRCIRGNHLALVREGRMGPDVAVMDRFTFSFDEKDIIMAEENTNGDGSAGEMTLAQVVQIVGELAPQVAKLTEAFAALTPAAAAVESGEGEDKGKVAPPAAPAAGESGEGAPAGANVMDAAEIERSMVARFAQRDRLASQISQHVGAFDHASMTLDSVVAYGCNKLGIHADKGHEAAALAGFLQAKPAALPSATVNGAHGMDSAPAASKGNFIDKHLTKGE